MGRNYRDAAGYVFLDREDADVLPGWSEITDEQAASMVPINRHERRAYAKWHDREVLVPRETPSAAVLIAKRKSESLKLVDAGVIEGEGETDGAA